MNWSAVLDSSERVLETEGTRQEGLEPPTIGLEGHRSVQLSYWR
jgi:hypothetical protein